MPQHSRASALIERSPFFLTAGPSAMAELLRASFTQLLPRGAVLFEQGDEADFLHMILEGSAGMQAQAERKGRTVVEIFGPGEVFIAPAVMLQLPYLVSAVALTEIRVLMIPAEVVRGALARSLDLNRAMTELLARHWRLMVDQVVDLKLRSAEERLSRFLARRVPADPGAGYALLPEPRSAIAARLGMTPETLSRAMAALEKRGKLRRGADGAIVADRSALICSPGLT
jgi:CRP/FNR family transcriptional activator FtrB